MEDFLTTEDYSTIISNYFRKIDPVNHSTKPKTINSHTIEPLSDKVEGFIGEHFILRIEVTETNNFTDNIRRHQLSFFLKLLNITKPVVIEIAQSINAYENEAFFYNVILKELREIGVDTSFAPQSYFMKMDRLMVLENLGENKEFIVKTAPKLECFDLEHCKVMLSSLANLHAGVIAYQHKKTLTDKTFDLAKEHSEILQPKIKPNNATNKWFKCTMEALMEVSELVFKDDNKKIEQFKKLFQEFLENCSEITNPVEGELSTILHSDLWVNNILFHYNRSTGLPVHVTLVDYQLIKYGSPAVDVVQAIATNTRKALRDEHYDTLLRHYYDEFGRWLVDGAAIATGERLEVGEVWPWREFTTACERVNIMARLRAFAARTMIFLPYEQIEDGVKTDEDFTNLLYDRTTSVIAAFKKDQLYSDIISEDLTELFQLLSAAKQ